MKDDDVRTKEAARTTPVVRGEVVAPNVSTASGDLTAEMEAEAREAEARAAEARAAELRARADQARSADGTR
jgi:sec-independent protein translocase protein TatA